MESPGQLSAEINNPCVFPLFLARTLQRFRREVRAFERPFAPIVHDACDMSPMGARTARITAWVIPASARPVRFTLSGVAGIARCCIADGGQ